ncbi:MAG: GNAT family N-acetyltransferase [Anaerolineae bacterium]|nr:GNAT family N-acetyltransferase [Anaerolineae bacterium]
MTLGKELLQGKLIRLTVLEKADMPQFAAWFSDIDFLRLMSPAQAYPFSLEEEETWYERQRKSDHEINFAIRLLEDNRLIGSCGLHNFNYAFASAKIGIGIGDPEARGKGYGTDTVQVLLKFAFLERNLHRVGLDVFSYNQRAIHTYEKVGFQHEGAIREAIRRDGKYSDIVLMGILRQEWEAAQR